ncbi:MarR family transcriptional regulator [Halomonas sp. MCCC 1A11036]|uniref:MarR family transcriptional regulator n=1 Tax=Billgrantia zhangzhouensis TaxID=2733481 RepID=A0ABS9AF24_9GAMM|nr:MarR family transcriptional regulator [Halomonas zhangzhouensis]
MPVKRRLQELSPSQRTILDLLRNHEGSSRAELAVLAGLSPAALTRQIKELLDLGLVMEGARRSGLRGQPALPLSLRPEAAYSIGLAFSLHEIEVVGIDFRGIRVARLSRPLRCHGATALTRQCSAMVRELEGMLPR